MGLLLPSGPCGWLDFILRCERASTLVGKVPGKTGHSLCTLLHDNLHEPHLAALLAALAINQVEKVVETKLMLLANLTATAQQHIACRLSTPLHLTAVVCHKQLSLPCVHLCASLWSKC
jgi:hypothetical protein